MTQNEPPIPFGGTVTQVRMSWSFMRRLPGSGGGAFALYRLARREGSSSERREPRHEVREGNRSRGRGKREGLAAGMRDEPFVRTEIGSRAERASGGFGPGVGFGS